MKNGLSISRFSDAYLWRVELLWCKGLVYISLVCISLVYISFVYMMGTYIMGDLHHALFWPTESDDVGLSVLSERVRPA